MALLFFVLSLYVSASPILKFVSDNSVDFGSFESRLEKKVIFKIKNSGDDVFKIFKVCKSCGCFKVNSFPKELEPGTSDEIIITLEAYGLSDTFSKMVFIHSNSSKSLIKLLIISGKAVPLYKISPSNGKLLIQLSFKPKSNKAKVYTFIIKATGKNPLILGNSKELNKKGVTVLLEKSSQEKNSYTLKVSISS